MENSSFNWTNSSAIRIEATSQSTFQQTLITLLKSTVLILIILLAIFSNLLVIFSVFLFRRLRHINNYFLVSLAFADLCVALFAMTFNATVEITGSWHFGPVMCNFWNAMDVHVSTVSTLHLCCISIDRFYAITKPFSYVETMTVRVAMVMILFAWLSPTAISFVPIFLGWYTTQEHIDLRKHHLDECRFIVNKPYAIISSTLTFWAPVLITLILYYRVYMVARQIKKRESVPSCPSLGQIDYSGQQNNLGQRNNSDQQNNSEQNNPVQQNNSGKQNQNNQETINAKNINKNGKHQNLERNVSFDDEGVLMKSKNGQVVNDTNIIAHLREKDKDIVVQFSDYQRNSPATPAKIDTTNCQNGYKPQHSSPYHKPQQSSPYHSFQLIDADSSADLRLIDDLQRREANSTTSIGSSKINSISTHINPSLQQNAKDITTNNIELRLWSPTLMSPDEISNGEKCLLSRDCPVRQNTRETLVSESNLFNIVHVDQSVSNLNHFVPPDESNLYNSVHPDQSNFSKSVHPDQSNFSNRLHQDQCNFLKSVYPDQSKLSESAYPDQSNLSEPAYPDQSNLSDSVYKDESNLSNSIPPNLSNSVHGDLDSPPEESACATKEDIVTNVNNKKLYTLECPASSGDETFCLLNVSGASNGEKDGPGLVESTRRLSQQCITVIEGVREKQRRWGTNWRKEHKAFVTLGVVVGAFLACWLPFFTWYLTVTICGSRCNCPDIIVSVLFWIGYLNSTLNPLIYAMTNHDFKEAFTAVLSKIFCCNSNSVSQCERNLWIKKFG